MSKIDELMKNELDKVRQGLDEHLSAINENTLEIQSLFDYLQEVEVKLEKLSQRLDQFQLSTNPDAAASKPSVSPLNQTERKVFLVLYTEEVPLSYREIAEKAQIPLPIVPECVSSLANKGIPFVRSFCNDQMFLKIEPHFKEIQAKENLVNLSLQSFME